MNKSDFIPLTKIQNDFGMMDLFPKIHRQYFNNNTSLLRYLLSRIVNNREFLLKTSTLHIHIPPLMKDIIK